MKLKRLLVLLVFASFCLSSQVQNPIIWTSSYKSLNAGEGEIIVSGQIQPGWHTYSQRPTDAGPISTNIQFNATNHFELIGKPEEIGVKEEYDKAFEAQLFVFSNKAEFKQKIKIKSKTPFSISFSLEYVCCNDNMCLPPKTIEMNVKIQ